MIFQDVGVHDLIAVKRFKRFNYVSLLPNEGRKVKETGISISLLNPLNSKASPHG